MNRTKGNTCKICTGSVAGTTSPVIAGNLRRPAAVRLDELGRIGAKQKSVFRGGGLPTFAGLLDHRSARPAVKLGPWFGFFGVAQAWVGDRKIIALIAFYALLNLGIGRCDPARPIQSVRFRPLGIVRSTDCIFHPVLPVRSAPKAAQFGIGNACRKR